MNLDKTTLPSRVQLGCGLIGIGRRWGVGSSEVPSEVEAIRFLQFAYELGIRFFDTAPAYGLSEKRLGIFLSSLTPDQRKSVIIATKVGEHWNKESMDTRVDHSYEAMARSIDSSLIYLGNINLLQLHKTSLSVLQSDDLNRAWEYARKCEILEFGASVTDLGSAQWVCEHSEYSAIQCPYNSENQTFKDIFQLALQADKKLLINRPFNMGQMTQKSDWSPVSAYRMILDNTFSGVILTGTKSIEHLKANFLSFNAAIQQLSNSTKSDPFRNKV